MARRRAGRRGTGDRLEEPHRFGRVLARESGFGCCKCESGGFGMAGARGGEELVGFVLLPLRQVHFVDPSDLLRRAHRVFDEAVEVETGTGQERLSLLGGRFGASAGEGEVRGRNVEVVEQRRLARKLRGWLLPQTRDEKRAVSAGDENGVLPF